MTNSTSTTIDRDGERFRKKLVIVCHHHRDPFRGNLNPNLDVIGLGVLLNVDQAFLDQPVNAQLDVFAHFLLLITFYKDAHFEIGIFFDLGDFCLDGLIKIQHI